MQDEVNFQVNSGTFLAEQEYPVLIIQITTLLRRLHHALSRLPSYFSFYVQCKLL